MLHIYYMCIKGYCGKKKLLFSHTFEVKWLFSDSLDCSFNEDKYKFSSEIYKKHEINIHWIIKFKIYTLGLQ